MVNERHVHALSAAALHGVPLVILVHDLREAARCRVPLLVHLATSSARPLTLRGLIAEVTSSHAVLRGKNDRRLVAPLAQVTSITRTDGRPWRPGRRKETDARAELAERADAHESNGGLE